MCTCKGRTSPVQGCGYLGLFKVAEMVLGPSIRTGNVLKETVEGFSPFSVTDMAGKDTGVNTQNISHHIVRSCGLMKSNCSDIQWNS